MLKLLFLWALVSFVVRVHLIVSLGIPSDLIEALDTVNERTIFVMILIPVIGDIVLFGVSLCLLSYWIFSPSEREDEEL